LCALAAESARDDRATSPAGGRSGETADASKGITVMLWTIIVILLVLWLLGLIGSVGGAFIHLLLLLAIIVFLAQVFTGRRSV
jgi:Family of unknown function (DUF5670)